MYGALALARSDGMDVELDRIKFAWSPFNDGRYARLEGRTLEVGVFLFGGEAGCFWEKDPVRVLSGETIGTPPPEEYGLGEPAQE